MTGSLSQTRGRPDGGPLCVCGHGLYEHYMCATPERSVCYHGDGCPRFTDPRFAPESLIRSTRAALAALSPADDGGAR